MRMKKTKLAVIAGTAALLLLVVFLIKPEITGNITAGVTLRITGMSFSNNCNITLASGWNLISVPCTISNDSVAYILAGIDGKYYSVHNYDSNDNMDHWKSYKPGLPEWVEQDLQVINSSRGYWIRMSGNESINLTGTITLPLIMHLEKGLNLVGYPTNKSGTPQELFAVINSSITAVNAYNVTDNTDNWKTYNPGGGLSDLSTIVPFWGYWINTTAAVNWQIPLG